MNSPINTRRGYILGLTAYGIWGMFPLYFKQLEGIAPLEVVAHRIIWSALLGALLLCIWRHPGWLRNLINHPKRLLALVVSGSLIACNWLTYVWAVHNEHMVEASLGYYINPLINVVLALMFLREKLRRLQWMALSLASVGVGVQIWQVGVVPWVALVLASTFGFYGLIRKQTPVAALPGLMVETWMLLPGALIWLWLTPSELAVQSGFWGSQEMLWLAAAGPVTLLPLIAFNGAAKHLPYSVIAFLQYITPTVLLLIAVWVYGEPFTGSAWLSFAFIWLALAIYSWDAWRILRRTRQVSLV